MSRLPVKSDEVHAIVLSNLSFPHLGDDGGTVYIERLLICRYIRHNATTRLSEWQAPPSDDRSAHRTADLPIFCGDAPCAGLMKKLSDNPSNIAVATNKSFFYWDGKTLVLNILGKPNAKQDAIGKAKGHQLKVSVTAAPRAGKATDHMIRFLAEEFGVATGDIDVVFGRMNVNKQLRIKSPKRLPAIIAQQELT